MTEPRNYPDAMMADAERERGAALRANAYHLPIQPTDEQRAMMRAVYARRVTEIAAANVASARYYTLTARGRLAAERVDAAERAQLARTKETR